MSEFIFILGLLFLYGIVKLLNLNESPAIPQLFSKDRSSAFVQAVVTCCPLLLEPYVPPVLWGKSGHLQTIVYAKRGRQKLPLPLGQRHRTVMSDGATLTFDVFQPVNAHISGGDYSLLVCPGIANNSEAAYVRTLVDLCQRNGYRLAVLNHLGSLKNEPLTSPRIFTYGDTDSFAVMTQKMREMYPLSKFIAIGFSMGGNIVVKYLGENVANQANFICGISMCQGYDVNAAVPLLTSWKGLGRCYLYAMTANMKNVLRSHYNMLFGEEASRLFGEFNPQQVFSAKTLEEIDKIFTCQRTGFTSVEEYYRWCSCSNYIDNISIPIIMLNAEDDPLVRPMLLTTPKNYATTHDDSIFVLTKHGGHLGFFEGSHFFPSVTTWMDRAIVQFANAAVSFNRQDESLLDFGVLSEEEDVYENGMPLFAIDDSGSECSSENICEEDKHDRPEDGGPQMNIANGIKVESVHLLNGLHSDQVLVQQSFITLTESLNSLH